MSGPAAGPSPRSGWLSERDLRGEVMDDPSLPPAEHFHALRGLSRLNRLSNSAGIVWPMIRAAARAAAPRRLRVLDVATGGGDVLIALARRAARAGLAIDWSGCDVSSRAIEHARAAADSARLPIDWFKLDVLREPPPANYDLITCSLFLHHLTDLDAIHLLRRLAAAARGEVVLNDLCRSRWGYIITWITTRLVTRSRVVHLDGPLSIRASFTIEEAAGLARRAGWQRVRIRRRWPFRFLLCGK